MVDRDLRPTPGELDREPQPEDSPAARNLARVAGEGLERTRAELRSVQRELRALDGTAAGGPSDRGPEFEARASELADMAQRYETARDLAQDSRGDPQLDAVRMDAVRHILDEVQAQEQGLATDHQEFRQELEDDMASAIDQGRGISDVIAAVPGVDESPTLDDITRDLAADLSDPSLLERAAGTILDPNTMFSILEVQKQIHNMQLEQAVADREFRRSVETAPDDLAGRARLHAQLDGLRQELRRVNNLFEMAKQLMRNQVAAARKAAAKEMAAVIEDLPADRQKAVFEALARAREARKRQGEKLEFLRELEILLREIKARVGYYQE